MKRGLELFRRPAFSQLKTKIPKKPRPNSQSKATWQQQHNTVFLINHNINLNNSSISSRIKKELDLLSRQWKVYRRGRKQAQKDS